jgi:translocator protein
MSMAPSKQVLGLLAALALASAAGAVGAVASISAADFYQELARPAWAPSAKVFGPVWSILYLLMGFSSWLIWRTGGPHVSRALVLYILQLGLNALWSWLFFAWHQGKWAFVDIVALWVLLVMTIISFWKVRPAAGALLLPYLLWVSFATALAYEVWQLNPILLG